MAKSIGNAPSSSGGFGDMLGGLLGAIAQAKETRRLEARQDEDTRNKNRIDTIDKIHGMTEDEQADYIELLQRMPEEILITTHGMTREDIGNMAVPSTTLEGQRQLPGGSGFPGGLKVPRPVLFPGDSPAARLARAHARDAEIGADVSAINLQGKKTEQAFTKLSGRAALKEGFRNEDGSELSNDQINAAFKGTMSDEEINSLRGTTEIDKILDLVKEAADFIDMNPTNLRRLLIGGYVKDNAVIRRLELMMKSGQVDVLPHMLEAAKLGNKVTGVQYKLLLKELNAPAVTGKPLSSGDVLRLEQSLEDLVPAAMLQLNPLYNPDASFDGFKVDAQGNRVPNEWKFWWDTAPAEIQGISPSERELFPVDALHALLGPFLETSGIAVEKYKLVVPTFAELGSEEAAERILQSFEQTVGFEFVQIKMPTDKEDVTNILTREQFKIILMDVWAAHRAGTQRLRESGLREVLSEEQGTIRTDAIVDPAVTPTSTLNPDETTLDNMLSAAHLEAQAETNIRVDQILADINAELAGRLGTTQP